MHGDDVERCRARRGTCQGNVRGSRRATTVGQLGAGEANADAQAGRDGQPEETSIERVSQFGEVGDRAGDRHTVGLAVH